MPRAYGCRKDPYDARDLHVRQFPRAAPPVARVDHRLEMPPVFDQGQAGTCVACATGYYDKGFQERREHGWSAADPARQYSPLFIYSQRDDRSGDNGMTIREAMKIVRALGVCPISEMPYDPAAIDVPPTPAQVAAALPYRARSFARITTIAEAEGYLATNCFVAGLLVHQSFEEAPGGNVPMPRRGDVFMGGHALCITGFDAAAQRFHFVNSWGPRWGDAGYGTIGYDIFLALLMDAWGMIDAPDGTIVPRGPIV
ncbi:MAG: C1 family peptidase [Candidatus Dormibacteria bacterium]